MNILFLTLLDFNSFEERNIYCDLLRDLIKNKNHVYCISPIEKKNKRTTHIISDRNNYILKLRIGNVQKVNLIEKGISTLLIEPIFISGIKKYFSNVKFDLIIYTTPPITFARVIKFLKHRDKAKTYLMLKDIFPQNSVDLDMLKTTGIKGIIYQYFRQKERKLYSLSDRIGCMSKANVDYLLKHNPEIPAEKVEICPNSIEPIDMRVTDDEKLRIRQENNLPVDKIIFVYGGNLGRPQDVPFIIKCLKACQDIENVFFVIAGSGTDMHYLKEYVKKDNPAHVKLYDFIPKNEYDKMIACCDVGLIFLDHRFTIPNFPSRLLSYMQAGLAVLACTDINTDIGNIIKNNGFGIWCESNSKENFQREVMNIVMYPEVVQKWSQNSYSSLCRLYNVENITALILDN